MLTLATAARALADAQTASELAALARHCGFAPQPAPLDAAARAALGLTRDIRVATVTEGPGVLRALCVEVPRGTCVRERIAQLALRVQRRSPFALWLVCVAERHGNAVALATAVHHPAPRASILLADRARVMDSDAETLRALAASCEGPDLLVHARWCEILGRDALTQKFFRALEHCVVTMADSLADVPPADARTLAILTATRLLFLSFLEAKGWLDGDHGFLRRAWDGCMAGSGGFHRRVLHPLCFGTLNTPRSRRAPAARALGRVPFLNGGLFNRTALEQRYRRALFPDDALGELVSDLLGRWRFTVREHDASLAEAAVDPEMLGRAFECLMASRERRASGTFYTPRALVERVFDAAMESALGPLAADPAGAAEPEGTDAPSAHAIDARAVIAARLASLRVLDPACGSGAFLVHALERLAALRTEFGDPRDAGALRRDILARQLFGVDREPTAVWLCELRLWLAVVVETDVADPYLVPPLPNLDAQVRVGDALAGDAFVASPARRASPLAPLRERYARATGARKRNLARALASAERAAACAAVDARIAAVHAARRDMVSALRGRDLFGNRIRSDEQMRARLAQLRVDARELRAERRALARRGAVAFDFAAQFADVGAQGGFDVVLGNPPWVRLHRIPAIERVRLRARFVTYREAGWRAGVAESGVSAGFAAQVDLAALFVERSLALVREHGTVSLLVPAKLWRSLAGGGVRHLLVGGTEIAELEDWSEARATFDAAVYPSLVVARRGVPPARGAPIRVAEHHRDRVLQWVVPRTRLAFDATPGAPWLWLPAEPRDGFDRIRELGAPLAEQPALRPRLGVKCGCNEAFVLDRADDVRIEPALLRPLLRGQHVTAWSVGDVAERMVFPHDASLTALAELPPLAQRWLRPYKARLKARTDLRGRMPWWSLFRLEAADATRTRVVWADMSRTPRAAVLERGNPVVPINSCYVVFTRDSAEAHALAAWLNSPIAAAWLSALAEPARGGFRRLLGWTVGLLPIPRDWDRAVELLAPIGRAATLGDVPETGVLLDATLDALGARRRDLEALLTWGHR